jgi:hypothetical protein
MEKAAPFTQLAGDMAAKGKEAVNDFVNRNGKGGGKS